MQPVSTEARYRLRPARQAEAEIIDRMVRGAGLNPMGLDWQRFTVAEAVPDPPAAGSPSQGEIIGCVQVKPHRRGLPRPWPAERARFNELASLVVLPAWRGRGVARALVTDLQQQVGAPLWLYCRSRLVPFYHRFGFREPQPAEMPRRFRLMQRATTLLARLARREERMAIMLWEGQEGEGQGAR
ncbi:MAG: GNAT family N-acetyltransferase [Candidatus Promineifilaceae bacterium]|nr:GNAT family N-acetyltransferase [Candidatus Promineifilaceae bacterium]